MNFLSIFFLALGSLLMEAVQGISSVPPTWAASDYFKSGTYHLTQALSHLYRRIPRREVKI